MTPPRQHLLAPTSMAPPSIKPLPCTMTSIAQLITTSLTARFVDGYNIYAYVQNRPVIFFDPMGLQGGRNKVANARGPRMRRFAELEEQYRAFGYIPGSVHANYSQAWQVIKGVGEGMLTIPLGVSDAAISIGTLGFYNDVATKYVGSRLVYFNIGHL